MTIKLYNTLTRKKEEFTPLHDGVVSMYHCGPTVYDFAHIGNLRSYVFADILRRTLEYHGMEVRQVINFTDVGHLVSDNDEGEDKVERAARDGKKTVPELTAFYSNAFLHDIERLNIKIENTIFPRASDHIEEQLAIIKQLEKNGFIYHTSDGMYFDTSRFPTYGALAELRLDDLKEGARVQKNPEKRNPADFAVWKFSTPKEIYLEQGRGKQKRQQEWISPWGIGFPGWHLECSAMAMKYLGATLDIHTGGVDHLPVHHTNEIAQSESVTGKRFVRYWLHHEHVLVVGKKMSKSEGNIITLEDIAEKDINPLSYRYWLLTAHYKKRVNFTWDALEGAQRTLDKLYDSYRDMGAKQAPVSDKKYIERFQDYINDDLNTPQVIALLWELIKDDSVNNETKKATLLEFDHVLALGLSDVFNEPPPSEIIRLITERARAREDEDWEKSDKLRDEIRLRGYTIKDTPDGPRLSQAS